MFVCFIERISYSTPLVVCVRTFVPRLLPPGALWSRLSTLVSGTGVWTLDRATATIRLGWLKNL